MLVEEKKMRNTSRLRITTLAENTVGQKKLLAEHGLALGIGANERTILFDTGQGMVLSHNTEILNFNLSNVHDVILSHGHYDHTGGLHDVIRRNPHVKIYAHPAILYSSAIDRTLLHELRDRLIPTEKLTEICDGLFVTGEIPRQTNFEEQKYYLDDQAAFFESDEGTVVLLGCSHSGVINTLQYVRELTGGRPIHTIIGGMHLVTASRNRMDQTIRGLRQLDVQRLGPIHCTGPAAVAELWSAFPGRCFSCAVGTKMDFDFYAKEILESTTTGIKIP